MEVTVLSFNSFTNASKAKKALLQANVRSKLVKLGTHETGADCTHGLEIADGDFYTAVKILREKNINYNLIKR